MTKLEVNLPDRTIKKLQKHSDDPLAIEPLVRRAIEQYLARLEKIDADAEYAKAHGHYPEPPMRHPNDGYSPDRLPY